MWLHEISSISSIAIDRASCLDNPSIFISSLSALPSSTGSILKIYQNKTIQVVKEGIKPVTSLQTDDELLYWSDSKCIQRNNLNSQVLDLIWCLPFELENKTDIVSLFLLKNDSLFVLLSTGAVFFLPINNRVNQTTQLIAEDLFKDPKILKYHENVFRTLSVIMSSTSPNTLIDIFIGVQNHGLLLEISLSCQSNLTSCTVINTRDVAVERTLPDFKLTFDSKVESRCSHTFPEPQHQVNQSAVLKAPQDTNILDSSSQDFESEEKRKYLFARNYIWILVGFVVVIVVFGILKTARDFRRSTRESLIRRDLSPESFQGSIVSIGSCKTKRLRRNSITVVNMDDTVSVEDLGGFSNPSFGSHVDNVRMCSKSSCDSCEYKSECKERGICLSTYRLLR